MKKRKVLAILMAVVMAITYMPVNALAEVLPISPIASSNLALDMPEEGNWSTIGLRSAISNGLIKGFDEKDGAYIRPNDTLTRAQMVTIVNRAFGANETASLSGVTDVLAKAWYYKDMQKAVKMGTMRLDNSMRPNESITRQEAFVILGRALKMNDGARDDLSYFNDASQISGWAVSAVGAMVKAGYIKGNNNLLSPNANMTRAEFAVIMNNVIKEYIKTQGTITEVAAGNVMINVAGVTLENVTITGDLILGDGIGDGTVTLKNVIVKGNLIARGGGIESIIITGGSVRGKVIISKVDGKIRVFAEGGAEIEIVEIDDGKDDVVIEGTVGTVKITSADTPIIVRNAKIAKIDIQTEGAGNITVADSAKVSTIVVSSLSTGTKVDVAGTVINFETSAQNTSLLGTGRVINAEVHDGANGTSITTGETVITNKGATGVTGGGGTGILPNTTVSNNKNGTGTETKSGTGGGGTTMTPVEAAELQLDRVDELQIRYIIVGGLTDAGVYVDVTKSKYLLYAALESCVTDDIVLTTEELRVKLYELKMATAPLNQALKLAKEAAETELDRIYNLQTLYIDAGGTTEAGSYINVTTSKFAVEYAIWLDVTADIVLATGGLKTNLDLLENTTNLLEAKTSANLAIWEADEAQKRFIAVGGTTEVGVYKEVTTTKGEVEAASSSGVTVDIILKTESLIVKLVALENEITRLSEMDTDEKRVASQELRLADKVQKEYLKEGGTTSNPVFTEVEAAKNSVVEALSSSAINEISSTTVRLREEKVLLAAATEELIIMLTEASVKRYEETVIVASTVHMIADLRYRAYENVKRSNCSPAKIIEFDNRLEKKDREIADGKLIERAMRQYAMDIAMELLRDVPQRLNFYTIQSGGLLSDRTYLSVLGAYNKLVLAVQNGTSVQILSGIFELEKKLMELAALSSRMSDELDLKIEAAREIIYGLSTSLIEYRDAGGSTEDPVYEELISARNSYEAALTEKRFQQITFESSKLRAKLSLLKSATELLKVKSSASLALFEADEAQKRFIAVGGLTNAGVYAAVTISKGQVQVAITGRDRGIANIISVTKALRKELNSLKRATVPLNKVLEDAKALADLALWEAGEAQKQFLAVGGKTEASVYINVTASKSAVELAIASDVPDDITSATGALQANLDALKSQSKARLSADLALSEADEAQNRFISAGGITDAGVYINVTTSKSAVELAIASDVTVDITSATGILLANLDALRSKTALLEQDLKDAKLCADYELREAEKAQKFFFIVFGTTVDTVYTDVTAAKCHVYTALESNITADINSAIAELSAKIVLLRGSGPPETN